MDNVERLKEFLTERPGRFFCNKCLSELIPIENNIEVNQLTRPLKKVVPYRLGPAMCSNCNRDRACIAFK